MLKSAFQGIFKSAVQANPGRALRATAYKPLSSIKSYSSKPKGDQEFKMEDHAARRIYMDQQWHKIFARALNLVNESKSMKRGVDPTSVIYRKLHETQLEWSKQLRDIASLAYESNGTKIEFDYEEFEKDPYIH